MALVELLNLFGNYDGFSVLLRVIEEVKISPAELAIGLHFLEKVLVFLKKQFILEFLEKVFVVCYSYIEKVAEKIPCFSDF
jgi:hypothetical protein